MQRSLIVVLLAAASLAPCLAINQDDLGRGDKLRVVVDKVLMAANGWVMTEDHVREIAQAGFNVLSPRLGNDDMAEVRKIAALAEKHGIFHLPWMRGSLATKTGVKMVWADGSEQDIYSPNAHEFWQWTEDLVLNYARISTEYASLFGVFLDYENYASGSKGGNCYGLSYDTKILGDFAQAEGIKLPALAPDRRYPWLKEEGLHERFEAFQINHWRERCRALREAVDAINPRFQFCVYPAPGTLFMTEAVWPEWATEQAPLILADATTYGRPTGMMPHKEALQANREALSANLKMAQQSGLPMIYMGGIDPVVQGADPEFSGKNAVMCADATDGYWIFYEGPTYTKQDHADYWKWFTWANGKIAAGDFAAQYQPRETTDECGATELVKQTDKPQLGIYGLKSHMRQMLEEEGTFEVHELGSMVPGYLSGFDVIVLQNFNVTLAYDSEWVQAFRRYVQEGGSLLLGHDTAWFMDSPFPEIAVRDIPTQRVEAERHVVETELRVVARPRSLGRVAIGTQFSSAFRDHMIFKVGESGVTAIENTFGDPVYVLGLFGRGKVAFSGCYYGYTKELEGTERRVFFGLLDWLRDK